MRVMRSTAGSVNPSRASRTTEEKLYTTAPSGPPWNQCFSPGWKVRLPRGAEDLLVPQGVRRLLARRESRPCSGIRRARADEVQGPPGHAHGLLLARVVADGRVPVLGQRLPRQQGDDLRRVPVRLHEGEDLGALALGVAEPEIGHLDPAALLRP